ncbi:MAG: helix-turn-helix domain-containing protein [Candidatus Limnocylindrales bacterium]
MRHCHREAIRSLGRDLLRLRTDSGATQREVSALAGIDHSHYSRIEAGVAHAGLKTRSRSRRPSALTCRSAFTRARVQD